MNFEVLSKEYDLSLAKLIRTNLKAHQLDIPGTVYFDEGLEQLSDYYLPFPDKRYYAILIDDNCRLIGGIGLAEFDLFDDCAELQKLYLHDSAKGQGIGYLMIKHIEDKARSLGYKQMYLETHTNLQAAIHIYEKSGYVRIDPPKSVCHGAMNRFYLKQL